MTSNTVSSLTRNAIVAALYVVVTMLVFPLSYNALQFRFAEILVLLVFFRKDYAVGLILGCAISNLISTLGFFDVLFGTIATALACVCIMFMKHLCVACIFPIVFNAGIVGFECWWLLGEPFWVSAGWVALGELVVMIVGYVIFMLLKKRKSFLVTLGAKQNLDFKF